METLSTSHLSVKSTLVVSVDGEKDEYRNGAKNKVRDMVRGQ